ncbi:hypothetical protein [Desulfurobacterium indicum]|uniref:Uncharacterized protein n=1 Tax=Desulfurobacterium indicum TaxID=1914305 RepID=A0A1R1MJK1_9BACT|nr:hypothetical protein [Desulfurobacterium indicum]OMH39943.1 hypothetical protein BLW93_07920 [Desulfurobacterium indicum]
MREELERKYWELVKAVKRKGYDEQTVHRLRNFNTPISVILASFEKLPKTFWNLVLDLITEKEKNLSNPLFYCFTGKPGRGKTLSAVRFMFTKLLSKIDEEPEYKAPLFMTSFELEDYALGKIELHRSYYGNEAWFEARNFSDKDDVIPFSQLTKNFDIILIDDVTEETTSHLEKVILNAYLTNTIVVFTTNVDVMEFFSPRTNSRLLESCVFIDFNDFPYLRDIQEKGGEGETT